MREHVSEPVSDPFSRQGFPIMDDFFVPNLIKILHIEDQAAEAAYVKSILEDVSDIEFQVYQASSIKDALPLARKNKDLDIILLDLTLPDSHGMTTLDTVQQAMPNKPIVLLTGEGDDKAALQYLGHAAQDYIKKVEFKPELLIRTIITAINRHRAHLDIVSREQRYRLVAASTSDGIWDWFIIKRDFWLSDEFYYLLGYESGEFPATLARWKECFHPDDRKELFRGIQRHLQDQSNAYHAEHRMQTKDGDYRWFLVRGQAMWNEKGDPVRMAGSISDITDIKMMRDGKSENGNVDQGTRETEATVKSDTNVVKEISAPVRCISDNVILCQETFTEISELLELYQSLKQAVEKKEDTGDIIEKIKEVDWESMLGKIPQANGLSLESLKQIRDILDLP